MIFDCPGCDGIGCNDCGGKGCKKCGGAGCPTCGATGQIRVEKCPIEYAGRDVYEVLEAADIWKMGTPPVHGGLEDQAKVFVDAARYIWSLQSKWRAELRLNDANS